eukprot:5844717-Amphidinium_carterae.1
MAELLAVYVRRHAIPISASSLARVLCAMTGRLSGVMALEILFVLDVFGDASFYSQLDFEDCFLSEFAACQPTFYGLQCNHVVSLAIFRGR